MLCISLCTKFVLKEHSSNEEVRIQRKEAQQALKDKKWNGVYKKRNGKWVLFKLHKRGVRSKKGRDKLRYSDRNVSTSPH